jgi:hypothetical protein
MRFGHYGMKNLTGAKLFSGTIHANAGQQIIGRLLALIFGSCGILRLLSAGQAPDCGTEQSNR